MRWGIAFAFAMGCASPSEQPPDDTPSCAAPPALAVPIATARDTGEPLHWRSDRCIDVTYEQLTADQAADLAFAIDAWSDVGCRSLCFDGPHESTAPLEGSDGRLHVTTNTGFPARATVVYLSVSGRIRGALIDVTTIPSRGELVRQLGLVIGLRDARAGVDSVLAPDYPRDATSKPTRSDGEALCTLYGDPPLCD